MPNTAMLMLGGMALFYFMRNQGAGTDKPGTISSLLGADFSSSGVGAFGGTSSAEVQTSSEPNVAAPFNLQGWLENLNLRRGSEIGSTVTVAPAAVAVDTTTAVPGDAANLNPPAPEIVGTLSPFFAEQGLTVSEESGMAVRQVGLLGKYDPLDVATSNNPQIGFVDVSTGGMIGNAALIDDEPVEVLRTAPGDYFVTTVDGDDGTTVVTSDVNKGSSYFSTPGTIRAAVDQGYFAPAAPYVPRSWQQIELESGLTERQESARESANVDNSTVYDLSVPSFASGGDWWGEG